MIIRILSPVRITDRHGVEHECKPGDEHSVFHILGRRLIYRRIALWVDREDFDPYWEPVDVFKAVKVPQVDKMIRKSVVNKGVA